MANLQKTVINDSGFITLPVGTTAQRPSSPELGMMRWNTDEEYVEFYNGAEWIAAAGGAAGLYEFTTATFTPGSSTGRTGPSLSQAQSGITASPDDSWKNNTEFFNVSGGIMEWTVPTDGTYRIQAYGAEGGRDTSQGPGGRGARMRGDFNLTSGQTINLVVGQKGIDHSGNGAGGGGGTFVYTGSIGGSGLLLAAGGGGGSGEENTANGRNALSSQSANNSVGGSNIGNGGSGGSRATAGAGWFSDGSGSASNYDGTRFTGGTSSGTDTGNGTGGFGGGGSNEPSDGGGGGGGYTGGNGTSSSSRSDWGGSGAGSFNSGTNQSNSSGANFNDGSVEITLL